MASKIDAVMSTSVALDTLKASSSLNTLAKAVRGTTSAWKAQEAQAKSSGEYLEASKAKYEGLGKSIEAQKARIAAIQDKMKDLDQTTQDGAKQAVKYGIDLDKATTSLKSMEAQQERAKAAMERQKSGLVSLEHSYSLLKEASSTYADRLQAEGKKASATVAKYDGLKSSLKNLSAQYKLQLASLEKIASESGKTSEAYTRQKLAVDKIGKSIAETRTKAKSMNGTISRLQPTGIRRIDTAIVKVKDHTESMASAAKNGFSKLKGAVTTASLAFVTLATNLVSGAKQASTLQNTYVENANLMSTAGEKQAEVQKAVNRMQADGKKYSIEYGESQKNIADGYQELIKRGYTSQQALGSMKSILQASKASGDDFNDTMSVTTSTMEAFGMKSDKTATQMKNTSKVANTLAMAADATSTNFSDLGVGMSYVGTSAKQAGLTLEDTASAMGVLSNSGIEADKAGTGLRKAINSLISPTQTGTDALKKYGMSVSDFKDKSGKLKDVSTIFSEISKKVPKGKQANFFHSVFGTTGQNAAAVLAQNVDQLEKVNKQVGSAYKNDYVGQLANKNMKSTQNASKQFQQAFKAVQIELGTALMPVLAKAAKNMAKMFDSKDFQNGLKSFAKGIGNASESLLSFISFLGKHTNAVKAFGSMLLAAFASTKIILGISKMRTAIGLLGKSMRAVKSSSTLSFFSQFSKGAMTAAKAEGTMTAAQKALNLVMNHNVFAIVVTSIIALGAAFVALYKHNKKFRDFINGIAKDASKFFKGFKKSWDNFWNGIGSWFSNKWNSMSKTFNNFIKGFNKLWNSFSKGLQKVWNAYWNGLGSWFSRKWNSMSKAFNNFTKGFNKLWNSFSKGLQKVWNAYWNGLFNFYKNIFNAIIKFFSNFGKSFNKSWTSFKNGFGKSWSSHWNAIKNFFGDIANAMYKKFTGWTSAIGKALSSFGDSFKRAWSDIGNAVKGIFSGLWKEMKSLAHNGMKAVVDVINKAIGGINGVIHLFGGKATTIDPIKFATGTGSLGSTSFRRAITKITPAIVNDEAGAANPELIFRKATGSIEYNKQPNAHTLLFPGDEVANATDSAKLAPLLGITHFAGGGIGDFFGGLWSGVTGFVSDVSKKLKQLWETGTKIVSDPAKALTSIMGDAKNSAKGFFPTIVKGGFNKTKDQAGKWWDALWSMVNLQGDSAGSYGGGWQSPGSGWTHTDGFGSPRSGGVHDGNDFSASIGSIFHAMHGGTVIRVGAAPAGWGPVGYNIVTKDSEGKEIIYQEFGNAGDVKVHVGQHVKQGDVLGRLGRSGLGTGPHLHVGLTNSGSVWSRNGMSTNGWLDITKQHGKDKGSDTESDGSSSSAKADSTLQKLAKSQVGSGFWKMIEKLAGLFGTPEDDGGTGPDGSGTNPQPTGSHKNWLKQAGIPKSQYGMYTYIINHESGWDPHATNPSSGAYGIPQSLPASKLASAGSDWKSNPITQIKWMKGYVNSAYGGIKNAYDFWLTHHAYANGGIATMPSIFGEAGPEMAIPLSASRSERASQLLGETVIHLAKNNPDKLAQQTSKLTNTDLSDLGKKMDLVAGELATMVQLLKLQISATKAGFDQNTLYRLEGKAQALADFQAL